MNIVQALQDRSLLGRVFPDLDSWSAWVVFLRSLFALPIPAGELEAHTALYREHTGREELPTGPAREGWVVAGRRAGKSRIAALVGVYLAAFRNYGEFLAPGERAVVMLIAGDRKQARVLLRYVRAFLELPMLKQMVERETKEAIDLNNGASLRNSHE